MIKIENLVPPSAEQYKVVINGMRNAYKSYDKADSEIDYKVIGGELVNPEFRLGENDRKLAKTLIGGDSPSHRKFLRQLPLVMDITAPLYFWKQLDTYKVGTTANSESTMHTLTKYRFTGRDFSLGELDDTDYYIEPGFFGIELNGYISLMLEIIDGLRDRYLETKDTKYWDALNKLLPQSYNQKRTWTANYEVVLTIINQRIHHKLPEWRSLIIYWLKNIPYLLEFAIADGVIKLKGSDVVINNKNEEFLFSLDEIES